MQQSNIKDDGLISVIMPAYNSAKTIRQSVESALNQTYSNIEIIITDDHSSDNTFVAGLVF